MTKFEDNINKFESSVMEIKSEITVKDEPLESWDTWKSDTVIQYYDPVETQDWVTQEKNETDAHNMEMNLRVKKEKDGPNMNTESDLHLENELSSRVNDDYSDVNKSVKKKLMTAPFSSSSSTSSICDNFEFYDQLYKNNKDFDIGDSSDNSKDFDLISSVDGSDKANPFERIYRCTLCKFKTLIRENFEHHLHTHPNMNMFACGDCDFICNDKSNLNQHSFVHSSIKLFKCDECGYKCNRKSNLKRHSFIHSNQKMFTCTQCSYAGNDKNNLKRHLLTHLKSKMFKCDLCHFSCNIKHNLKRHLVVHTSTKLYQCSECKFACNWKQTFKQHLLQHAKEKQFNCSQCDYACNDKRSWKKHSTSHSNISDDVTNNIRIQDDENDVASNDKIRKNHSTSQFNISDDVPDIRTQDDVNDDDDVSIKEEPLSFIEYENIEREPLAGEFTSKYLNILMN